jgi:O-antigen/teichoic acid export membrane protein
VTGSPGASRPPVRARLSALVRSCGDRIRHNPVAYRLARGTFWSFLGSVASRLLTMTSSVIVARLLGKEHYGELGMVVSTLGMFSLFAGFGLGGTANKYLAEFRSRDPERAGRILSLTNTVALLTSGAVAAALVVFAPLLARTSLGRPSLSPLLVSGAAFLLFSTLASVQKGPLAGFEAFRAIARINLWEGVATLASAVPLVWYFGVQGAILSMTASAALAWLMGRAALARECRGNGIALRPWDLSGLRERSILWRFSLPSMVSGLMVMPATWAANTILTRQPGGYSEFGLFNAANQWRVMIMFVPQILGAVMMPIFSETHGHPDGKQFLEAVDLNLKLTCAVALPATVLLIALRQPLAALFGRQYAGIETLVTFLMIASFLSIVNNVVGIALAAAGRMWTGTLFNLGWAAVLIGGTWLLAPRLNALGLALATLAAYLLHTVWQMAYLETALAPTAVSRQAWLILSSLGILSGLVAADLLGLSSPAVGALASVLAFLPLVRLLRRDLRHLWRSGPRGETA